MKFTWNRQHAKDNAIIFFIDVKFIKGGPAL